MSTGEFANPPSGYVNHLNATQEEKLHQFWRIVMQSWDSSIPGPDPARKGSVASTGSGKSHRRFFSLGRPAQPTDEELASIPPNLLASLKALDAEPATLKSVATLLKKIPGSQLRGAIVDMLKQDHPDALMLRYIRAEKWNIPKAWVKFVSAVNWRSNVYRCDEEVTIKGEEHMIAKSKQTADVKAKKDGEGFMLQCHTGKGYFHGCDKWGRPVCYIRVRLHDPKQQTEKGLNDYIIHCIENVRLMAVPPVETMAIVFDLTGFGLHNWDFPPIKFIIDSFQEFYPESLGAMIFYNAPWIFSGFWKIIHGILDPVVASKVHFLSGAKELQKIIPMEHIVKEVGGGEDWEYKYIDPFPGENDRLKDSETREKLVAERTKLADELYEQTAEWIAGDKSEDLTKRRKATIDGLRESYWRVDPYIRARSLMDRTGVINEGGKIEFYPAKSPEQIKEQVVNEKHEITTEHIDNAQPAAVAA